MFKSILCNQIKETENDFNFFYFSFSKYRKTLNNEANKNLLWSLKWFK